MPHHRTTIVFLAALSVAFFTGCPDDTAPADAAADSGPADAFRSDGGGVARVELGTGLANFVDIPATGADLELIAGPQGGWHLEATARLYELTVEGLLLSYRIERGGTVISMPVEFGLSERRLTRDGDRWLRAGDQVRFEITEPADVVGDVVELIVIANPTDGEPVTDSRAVTVIDLVDELAP
ncbi:MAG: hypothetical protein JRH11_24925 [Deltaproteobacteria bacterium]|nr:hypothetical protein [Deltaproteobacteria bacterium]